MTHKSISLQYETSGWSPSGSVGCSPERSDEIVSETAEDLVSELFFYSTLLLSSCERGRGGFGVRMCETAEGLG